MTATVLQNELIGRISSIEDINLLQSIKENIDLSKSNLKLSDFQLNRIKESEKQLANGQYIEQDALILKMQQWLKTK